MKSPIWKEEKQGFTAYIYYDDDPCDPREWYRFTTMYCYHKRYHLGDKQTKYPPMYLRDMIEDIITEEHKPRIDTELVSTPNLFAIMNKHFVWQPLFLYDHSGLSLSTSRGYDVWDTSFVGIIYAHKTKIIEEYGEYTEQTKEKVRSAINAEIETYNAYLNGDIYGYTIEDSDGELLESCWGYYNLDETINLTKKILDETVQSELQNQRAYAMQL